MARSDGNGTGKALTIAVALLGMLVGVMAAGIPLTIQVSNRLARLETQTFPWNTDEAGSWRRGVEEHTTSTDVHMAQDKKDARYVRTDEFRPFVERVDRQLAEVLLGIGELKGRLEERGRQ